MKRKTALLGMAFILGMGVGKSFAASPSVLLTIDDSNPSAVTITATGENSAANDTGHSANDGVDLLSFFNQNDFTAGNVVTSTLQGGNLTLSYNFNTGDNYSTGVNVGDLLDLNLYNTDFPASSDSETFSTTQPAFTGSLTLDLSSLDPSALPAAGTTGDIIAGYGANPGAVIGSWQVETIPEPGIGSLLILGSGAGFTFWRHRIRKNGTALS